MAVLDASIVNVGLPTLMASFGVTVDKIEWVATAYLLVLAVMLPTFGWVADHFGYKRTYLLALVLFTTGSFAMRDSMERKCSHSFPCDSRCGSWVF